MKVSKEQFDQLPADKQRELLNPICSRPVNSWSEEEMKMVHDNKFTNQMQT